MQAFFLPIDPGQRFCLFHPARGTPRGRVLYSHPFAEEMNKSRRMAALQARALADAGFAVLQIDLLGCGDSTGDFADAHWGRWVDDLVAAHGWLRAHASGPLWLWGLRAGCLLAVQMAAQIDEPCHFLFWQPATAGKPLIQQFLRLKTVGEMIGGGEKKGGIDRLRQQLACGESVEVAGYALAPALVSGFDRAVLRPPDNGPAVRRRVEWIELSKQPDASLSPASSTAVQRWRDAGCNVTTRIVPGPAFWQTSEIEEAPELLDASLAAMSAASAASSEGSA